MPFTRCPKCRRIQRIEARVIGKEMGCLNGRCDKLFFAKEYRIHSGAMSQFVFMSVVVFAAFLAINWWYKNAEWFELSVRMSSR